MGRDKKQWKKPCKIAFVALASKGEKQCLYEGEGGPQVSLLTAVFPVFQILILLFLSTK